MLSVLLRIARTLVKPGCWPRSAVMAAISCRLNAALTADRRQPGSACAAAAAAAVLLRLVPASRVPLRRPTVGPCRPMEGTGKCMVSSWSRSSQHPIRRPSAFAAQCFLTKTMAGPTAAHQHHQQNSAAERLPGSWDVDGSISKACRRCRCASCREEKGVCTEKLSLRAAMTSLLGKPCLACVPNNLSHCPFWHMRWPRTNSCAFNAMKQAAQQSIASAT